MKRIKTYERFISESFTNLELGQLETILTKWQKENFSYVDESSPYLTFEINSDSGLIEYGYTGYEDSEYNAIKLDISDDVISAKISYDNSDNSLDSTEDKNFTDIDLLIDFLYQTIKSDGYLA